MYLPFQPLKQYLAFLSDFTYYGPKVQIALANPRKLAYNLFVKRFLQFIKILRREAAGLADSVLIVDSDAHSRTVLSRALRSAALHTESAVSGEEALERLWRVKYDLVVLDVDLPGLDGFRLVQDLRRRGVKTPVIICSAHGEDYEQIYGLDIGADDFVVKPFSPLVFAAKARALIRRSRGLPMDDVLSAGPFTYNASTLRFYKNGDEIVLSSKENAIMKLFMDNVDRVFSRSRLYDLVWGGSLVDENTVMVYISRLRSKIEDDPAHPRYIQTVRGLGYRFVAK